MTIEILFALVLMLGIASGVAQPSRLALIPTLVDRESLASALAINSVIFNLARFIGPALAGIVIAEIGIAAAFAANAVSYIAFQISLLNLRGLPPQPAVGRQNVLRASVEAFSYAYRHPGIGPMLLLFIVTTIGTRGFIELFPGFADRVFGRGPQGLAMLTSTVGLGAGARRDCVGRLLAGDAVPAQAHGGGAGTPAHRRDGRPPMTALLSVRSQQAKRPLSCR